MLHQLAKMKVKELAAKGVTLDAVEDFDHLVNLDRLARAAADAAHDWKTRRAFFPTVGIANVVLRRPSVGAWMFFTTEVLPALPPNDANAEVACVAFVLAHAEDPARHLLPFAGRPEAFAAAVNAWLKTVGATWAELDAAVAKLLAPDAAEALLASLLPRNTKRDRTETAWAEITAALAAEFGRDPEWWMWSAPDELTLEMLSQLNRRRESERTAETEDGTLRMPDPNSAAVRARRALGDYVQLILKEKGKAA